MKFVPKALVYLLLAGCSHEAGQPLGDGYLHVDTDSHNTWVVHGHDTIVDSNVTRGGPVSLDS